MRDITNFSFSLPLPCSLPPYNEGYFHAILVFNFDPVFYCCCFAGLVSLKGSFDPKITFY